MQAERKTEMQYTAVIKRSGEWWIGWIEEAPGVNCQERTREELRLSFAETLSEALDFNRQDALAANAGDLACTLRLPNLQTSRNRYNVGQG